MKRPTVAITEDVCRALRAGIPLETALRYVLGAKWHLGVEWLMVAERQHPTVIIASKAHKHFHDEVIKAEAHAVMRNAVTLQKSGSPRFALEWLKRRAPQQWTATEHVEISAQPSEALIAQLRGDSPVITGTAEERALITSIRALRSRPYTDPRLRELPAEPTEPAVIVEDVLEIKVPAECDRPHVIDVEDTITTRVPAALVETNKRSVL